MSGNSPGLTLIVSVITITLAVILFEVIPMKNIYVNIYQTRRRAHGGGSGFWRNLLYADGRNGGKKAPSINHLEIPARNSKIKLTHQGFRIEEDVVKLLAREANKRQISVSSLVNIILKTHFTYRKYFEESGFIPVSKDFLERYSAQYHKRRQKKLEKALDSA